MASGNGVGNAVHSGKQDLGPGRITEESTCSSWQVGLSTKGDVRLDHPIVQGQISCEGKLIQLDVKTTFLHGDLQEEIYMEQPKGFVASSQDHLVCQLRKSI